MFFHNCYFSSRILQDSHILETAFHYTKYGKTDLQNTRSILFARKHTTLPEIQDYTLRHNIQSSCLQFRNHRYSCFPSRSLLDLQAGESTAE